MSLRAGELRVGDWRPLAGDGGTALALDREYTVAAGPGGFAVWSGTRLVAAKATSLPGRPRIARDAVFCGDGRLDLARGDVRRLDGIQSALGEGTDALPLPPPGEAGYIAAGSGWAPDGEALAVTATWDGPPGPPDARAVLFDGSGAFVATLWEGSDLAPKAVWLGRNAIVLGTREPRVFSRDGALIATLKATTPAVRIEADAGERQVILVEHGKFTLWEAGSWERAAEWEGGWLDAAISPSGAHVAAVDLFGSLHAGTTEGGRPLIEQPQLDPVQAVALGESRIAAGFARGEPIRTADLV